jgi:hypothetical protein
MSPLRANTRTKSRMKATTRLLSTLPSASPCAVKRRAGKKQACRRASTWVVAVMRVQSIARVRGRGRAPARFPGRRAGTGSPSAAPCRPAPPVGNGQVAVSRQRVATHCRLWFRLARGTRLQRGLHLLRHLLIVARKRHRRTRPRRLGHRRGSGHSGRRGACGCGTAGAGAACAGASAQLRRRCVRAAPHVRCSMRRRVRVRRVAPSAGAAAAARRVAPRASSVQCRHRSSCPAAAHAQLTHTRSCCTRAHASTWTEGRTDAVL